ncbi:hypothetical protein CJ483_04930 [Bacillus sp. PK3_68]|nr:hypothetical protein CJ483_04930 [Bacillus sp. PK3_68]
MTEQNIAIPLFICEKVRLDFYLFQMVTFQRCLQICLTIIFCCRRGTTAFKHSNFGDFNSQKKQIKMQRKLFLDNMQKIKVMRKLSFHAMTHKSINAKNRI